MTNAWIDPLIPLEETAEITLTRLSRNIATLSTLMSQAEGHGRFYLAGLFRAARAAKIKQARACMAPEN